MLVRPPAVAGSFYPASSEELAGVVDRLLSDAKSGPPAKVVVVPHAGFAYSGPIAASAWKRVGAAVERIVLIGPAHRVAFRGLRSPGAARLATPLGELAVDTDALERADVPADPGAHAREHSLEVELPFIQRVAPQARIVPIAASHASAEQVGRVIDELWGGPETVIAISSDLSHYHPYDEGRARDRRTVSKILAHDAAIAGEEACGCVGLNGLAWVATRRRLDGELLDLRSSGDTAGSHDSVVGYAAIAFAEAA
ncbi:MAG TPA: AmmeMemoRadiSam system protein B [Kofleriaceae bacterium]|jgi:hypothetical protein